MRNIFIYKDINELSRFLNDSDNVFVVIDSNLKHLHSHFEGCNMIEIPTSEQRKTLESVVEIIGRLLESGADRGAFVLGVGGGITTDIAGFAASIYKRGVKFGFVPTTLLAQVDASIGGKNGANFESYKNIVGTITQPQWVYICSEVLRTLHPKEFRAGVAEVLKTFILFDKEQYAAAVEYFSELEQYLASTGSYLKNGEFYKEELLLEIIGKCAEYKSAVVERDEFERGERRMLNLGHTFAHAIEKICGDTPDYGQIMHGEAVAIGMVLAARLAACYYGISSDFAQQLERDLKSVGLPIAVPSDKNGRQMPLGMLVEALRMDKKVAGESIHFILPKRVGEVNDVLVPLKIVEEISCDLC